MAFNCWQSYWLLLPQGYIHIESQSIRSLSPTAPLRTASYLPGVVKDLAGGTNIFCCLPKYQQKIKSPKSANNEWHALLFATWRQSYSDENTRFTVKVDFVRSLAGPSSVSVTSRLLWYSSGEWINVIIVGNSDRVSNGQRVHNSTWDQRQPTPLHHKSRPTLGFSSVQVQCASSSSVSPVICVIAGGRRQYRCCFSGTPNAFVWLGLSPFNINFDRLRSFLPRHRV